MTNRIIDAQDRFQSARQKSVDPAEVEKNWADRQSRQNAEAADLRRRLASIARLDVADRKIIARNLGRAIERKHNEKPTLIVGQLFRILYGEEGGLSKEKKRKRYIRFDGDPLNDHAIGEEYAANGREFLRLIEGLADIQEHGSDKNLARDQMLLFVCDGVSFCGPSRPRLLPDVSLFEKVRRVNDSLIDQIVKDTSVVEYLDEVRNYTIETHPRSRNELAPEVGANLHQMTFPVEEFEYISEQTNDTYDEYSRLRLGGFDIRAEAPSPLYPRMRLARIYWPRQVLCLPAFVSTGSLVEIRNRELSPFEVAEALREYEPFGLSDKSDEDIRRHAIIHWRRRQEHQMWRDALSESGSNPDTIDWASFEDELDGTALNGAEWRTFWQAMSVDLHLVADGQPDLLHFGLSFGGGSGSHWTHAPKDLSQPKDDDVADAVTVDCCVCDEPLHVVAWLPAGEKMQVCRAFWHFYDREELDRDQSHVIFDNFDAPVFHDFLSTALYPVQDEKAWALLNMRMKDWRIEHRSPGTRKPCEDEMPSLRPLFDAPHGWTPAPDGSLAAAIFRSLAYGEGNERLDTKFIAATNNLVRCFSEMKEELSQKFNEGLSRNGYAD